jgi:septal ring factor EnvC (AmiA/AmiB activator)
MKCSQCGGEKFIETQLWGYDFSYGQMSVEVYLCIECGHHELFNKNLAEKYRTLCKEMEDVKNKIIEQKKIVDKYENVVAKYDEETNKLISRSTSLDITIREQQELIKEIEARKKDREKNIPKSLREERAKLQQLTRLFEILKKEKASYKEV